MQDEQITLGGFQGNSGWVYNVYIDIRDEMATLYRGPSIDFSCHVC
jgi:hypothetical protein